MNRSIRIWLIVNIALVGIIYHADQTKAESANSLPKIINPTQPPALEVKPSVEQFLASRTRRFDVKGRITDFKDGKIWVNNKGFTPSKEIQYRRGKTKLFPSNFKKGMEVGLVLWPDSTILQVWALLPR